VHTIKRLVVPDIDGIGLPRAPSLAIRDRMLGDEDDDTVA
jgi:hypothetical protein